MRRRFFTNPYKATLQESAKLIAPSEDTCQQILGAVMTAAGVTSAVSFAAASAKAASLGKAALAKTAAATVATTVCTVTVAVTGVSMMLPPRISSVEASGTSWEHSSISITTNNNLATRHVALIDQNGDTYYAGRDETGRYQIEVYQNGVYTVEVTGQNGQTDRAQVSVHHLDHEVPAMTRYDVEGEAITIFFQDAGAGVNWDSFEATDGDGKPVSALRVDRDQGSATFPLPESSLTILVEDLAGNLGQTTVSVEQA